MNEQQKIQYIAHTISLTILNSIITNLFFFFPKHLPAKHRVFVKGKG